MNGEAGPKAGLIAAPLTLRVPRLPVYAPRDERAVRAANLAGTLEADRIRRGLRSWSDWRPA